MRRALVPRSPPPARAAGDAAELAPNLTPPPGNPRFARFDALRAIAALSVFLGHTVTGLYTFQAHPNLFLGAVQLAYQGVAIFFLISGFLLYRPFVAARRGGRRVGLSDYLRRRVLRIVPAYWVALSLFIAAGFVSGVTTHNWWVFYGFGQVYSATMIGHGIGVAWTLCIEVTFYLALPLIAALAAHLRGSVRAELALLVALSAGSLLFRAHFNSFFDVNKVSTLAGTFAWFALGMGLAIASVEDEHRPTQGRLMAFVAHRTSVFWAGAGVLCVGQYELIHHGRSVPAQLLSHVLYAVIALFVLVPGVFGERTGGLAGRVLGVRWLTWIGLISYAFYLYHSVVIAQVDEIVRDAGVPARYPVVLVVSFLLTTCVSAASYYLLERPIMRWGSAHARRRSGTALHS